MVWIGHFGDVPHANLLAQYGKTKPNTTKAHIHQSNKNSSGDEIANVNFSLRLFPDETPAHIAQQHTVCIITGSHLATRWKRPAGRPRTAGYNGSLLIRTLTLTWSGHKPRIVLWLSLAQALPWVRKCFYAMFTNAFWATVCKMVRSMLSDHCPVCDVGVLWPNGWTDQDETWHTGRPRPRPHC